MADNQNHLVRKISSTGVVTTLAGSVGDSGSDNGIGTAAKFNNPATVIVDGSANVYVADLNNHCIRKIDSSAVVTTLAGSCGSSGTADGTADARFYQPDGLALDNPRNLR